MNVLISSLEDTRSKRDEDFDSFMAKIKFQSIFATVSDQKCNEAYIYLSATH